MGKGVVEVRDVREVVLQGCVALSVVNWVLEKVINLKTLRYLGTEFTESL